MGKICPRCGSHIGGDCKFCPDCGLELPSAVNMYNNGYKPENTADSTAMSLKDWIVTILVTNVIPLVSFVFTIVWAFSNDIPAAKKRYCQALLIYNCVMSAAVIILIVFIFIIGIGCVVGTLDYLSEYAPNALA